MHINRKNIERFWPIPRKGTKYIAVSSHNKKISIPLIVAVRDILNVVRTKKELKRALNEKHVKINEKLVRETNYPISLFDIISINGSKNYRAILGKNGKLIFEEVSDNTKKVIKIIGKKILKNGIIQFNLSDGRNFLYNLSKDKEKAEINDSILFNFKENKIEKIIKMRNGNKGFVFKGKHAGVVGNIEDILERGGKKLVVINNKEKINVWIKNVITVE